MTSMVIGFAIRYIPKLFGFAGGMIKEKQERKDEEKLILLQGELENRRLAAAGQSAVLQGELAESLAGIQAEITALADAMQDKKDARSYGLKLASLMDKTLARGKELGIHPVALMIGWGGVLFVEMASAAVQPFIAIATLAMWMHYKIAQTDLSWTAHDWWLMETIVGFYLAGRVQKHTDKDKDNARQ